MHLTLLSPKQTLPPDTTDVADGDVLPLRWSIPVWLVLAAASWTGVYFAVSLVL